MEAGWRSWSHHTEQTQSTKRAEPKHDQDDLPTAQGKICTLLLEYENLLEFYVRNYVYQNVKLNKKVFQ